MASDEIDSFDVEGPLVGGQIGYNAQFGNFVLGVEADAAWSDINGGGVQFEGMGVTATADATVEWLASIRGRAGVAFDRLLLYGTGGIAFGGVDFEVSSEGLLPSDLTASDSNTHIGWVAGLGAEYALTDQVTIGVEAKYYDLGSEDYEDPETIEGSASLGLDFWTTIVKANYRF